MDVASSFVADDQAAEAVEPGMGSLDHPAVPAEALAALDAFAGDAGDDAAGTALVSALAGIVGLVGVQLVRSLSWPATAPAQARDRIEGGRHERTVVLVGACQPQAERRAAGIGDDVALGARLAAIGRIGAGLGPPLFAGTVALSSAARRQSIWPAACSRSSSRRCKAAHTPAACQSRKRRQHDMPQPQPISCGRYSHGMPVLSTKMMPLSAARSGIGGRPPLGFGRSGGSSGVIAAQRSSGTRGRAMHRPTPQQGFR